MWPMGAAIVRPSNTEIPNTQSIGACWEKLPKTVKITLLQFNYEFGHEILHSVFFTIFSKYLPTEKNIYRWKLS